MKKRIKISASSCVDMIHAINSRIAELDPSQIASATCTGQQAIEGAEDAGETEINDAYVDELMQYVADEVASGEDVQYSCTWELKNKSIVITLAAIGKDGDVEEYTCPIADLTGDIDTDIDYICDAINS